METSHLRVHENLQSDATSFFEDLRTRGFALVRMRAQTVHAVQRGWKLCGKDHGRVTYDSLLEFGYSGRVEAVNKAFFAVKCAQPLAMLPWPNDEFRDDAVELFGALDAEARWILERIGSCLRVEWSKFFEMLDEIPLSCNEISTSFMHLFDYLPQVSHGSETCSAHTDSGLVTIIPRATAPGLEVLDFSSGEWKATELEQSEDVCTVLVGETLARLTCHYLQASVHRVIASTKIRLSVPFQLRASVHATIDSVALGSPLYAIPQHFKRPLKVADFLG